MKVLYITNIAPKEGIGNFSISAQGAYKNLGIQFHIAANFAKVPKSEWEKKEKNFGLKMHHIDICRNPFNLKSIVAIRQIREIITKEHIEIVHCNTPAGGVCGRIAASMEKVKVVIYQAHGFHFYHRAPIVNWLLYYPAERIMARLFTDVLLTINEEDYNRAKKFKLRKGGRVYQTLGVGLDTSRFESCVIDRKKYRRELGIPDNAVVLLTVGAVESRKNQKILIKALNKIRNSNIYLLICGEGIMTNRLRELSKSLNIEKNVLFLGRRNDIAEICHMSDIFCFPSKREGMGIAALEAMAAGLPLITSNIQGIKDFSKNGKTGYCLEYDDLDGFVKAIEKLASDMSLRQKYGDYNKKAVLKYDHKECIKVYQNIIGEVIKLEDIK